MLKKLTLSTVSLLAITLGVHAQAPSVARMGMVPANPPTVPWQTLQVLDNTNTWVPLGNIFNHIFSFNGDDWVSVLAFGADPTKTVDSTTAFRNAIATGNCVYVPTGNYLISDAVTLPATNGCIRGDGRTRSVLWAYASGMGEPVFNLGASGLLVLPNNSGGSGGIIRDIGVEFQQPQVNIRSSIVAFPPAIYAQGQGRGVIQDVRVSDANGCLDARGNDGGWFVDNFECGALTYGMLWDGSLDTVHWKDFHFWPFGNQLGGGNLLNTVYSDQSNICFSNGRIDDLDAKGISCFKGNAFVTANASDLEQDFHGLFLDASAQLNVSGGLVKIEEGYNTGDSTNLNSSINVSAGNVWIGKWRVGTGLSPVTSVVVTGGRLTLDHTEFNCSNVNVACATVSGGLLAIHNSILNPGAVVYNTAYIAQSSTGFLDVKENMFFSGSGPGINYATDATANVFLNNLMNGWTVNIPSGHTLGQYYPNELGYVATPQGSDPGLLVNSVAGNDARIVLNAPTGQNSTIYQKIGSNNPWATGPNSVNTWNLSYNGNALLCVTSAGVAQFGCGVTVTVGLVPQSWTDTQTCTPGQITVDAGYIYVCTATNTVKRVALSAF